MASTLGSGGGAAAGTTSGETAAGVELDGSDMTGQVLMIELLRGCGCVTGRVVGWLVRCSALEPTRVVSRAQGARRSQP